MKHKYKTCDICGKKLNYVDGAYLIHPKFSYIYKFGFGLGCNDLDICNNCWDKIKTYIKGDSKC